MGDRDSGIGPTSRFEVDDGGSNQGRRPAIGGRLRSRAGQWFGLRPFLVQMGLGICGILVVGGLLPFGGLADLLGLCLAGFGTGLVSSQRAYMEAGIGGALVGGVWAFLGNPLLALVGVGSPIVGVGFVSGGVAAVVGHYFGRDLRDGLTRDL